MAARKNERTAYHKRISQYDIPVQLTTVLDLLVIHNREVRTIGSLDAEEFYAFVVNHTGHGVTLNAVLDGISQEFDISERWYVLLELKRMKSVKLCLYHSQEDAEKALKMLQEQQQKEVA